MKTEDKRLNSLFIHSKWYRTKNEKTGGWKAYETKRNALIYFAYSGDFVLDNKEDTTKVDILRHRGKEKGSYKISDFEIRYFVFLKLVKQEYNHILKDINTRELNKEMEREQQEGAFYWQERAQIRYDFYKVKKKCIEGLKGFHNLEMHKQLLHLLNYNNFNLLKDVTRYNLN